MWSKWQGRPPAAANRPRAPECGRQSGKVADAAVVAALLAADAAAVAARYLVQII